MDIWVIRDSHRRYALPGCEVELFETPEAVLQALRETSDLLPGLADAAWAAYVAENGTASGLVLPYDFMSDVAPNALTVVITAAATDPDGLLTCLEEVIGDGDAEGHICIDMHITMWK